MLLFLPPRLGESFSVAPDAAVLCFTACISIISAIVFWPGAGFARNGSRSGHLAQGRIAKHRWRRADWLRKVLVLRRVAFSVVLVGDAVSSRHQLAACGLSIPDSPYQNVMTRLMHKI